MAAASSLPAPATATTRPLRRLPPPETDDVTKRRHPERSVAERAISLDYLVVAGGFSPDTVPCGGKRGPVFCLFFFSFCCPDRWHAQYACPASQAYPTSSARSRSVAMSGVS